jgi:hypothetical protein
LWADEAVDEQTDGKTYAVLSILKANGDSNNPADWETWTSPIFALDRP